MEKNLITLVDDAEEYSFFLRDPEGEQLTDCEVKYRRLSAGDRRQLVKRHTKQKQNRRTGVPFEITDWEAVSDDAIVLCVKSWGIMDTKTGQQAEVNHQNIKRLPDFVLAQIADKLQVQNQGPGEDAEKNLSSSSASSADTPA